jgi:hypothetical protein
MACCPHSCPLCNIFVDLTALASCKHMQACWHRICGTFPSCEHRQAPPAPCTQHDFLRSAARRASLLHKYQLNRAISSLFHGLLLATHFRPHLHRLRPLSMQSPCSSHAARSQPGTSAATTSHDSVEKGMKLAMGDKFFKIRVSSDSLLAEMAVVSARVSGSVTVRFSA